MNALACASPEQLAGQDSTVPRDHPPLRIHQHRYVESERLDAARNLTQVPWVVNARVLWIQLQVGDLLVADLYATSTIVLHPPHRLLLKKQRPSYGHGQKIVAGRTRAFPYFAF
jgi:hypothetical protein